MSRSHLDYILKGEVDPKIRVCDRIADAVGIPLPWLLDPDFAETLSADAETVSKSA